MKSLVLYYSLEGNTKSIAEKIAKVMQSDLIELIPEKETPKDGLKKYIWGGKSVLFRESPRLLVSIPDLSDYDLIFIGSPLWAGSYAPAVHTLLKTVSFSGKRVALFICHSGGSTVSTHNRFKAQLESAKIEGFCGFKDPLAQNQEVIDQDVQRWLNEFRPLI